MTDNFERMRSAAEKLRQAAAAIAAKPASDGLVLIRVETRDAIVSQMRDMAEIFDGMANAVLGLD